MKLTFDGTPKAVQSFRFAKSGRRYQPPEIASWKNYIRLSALTQLPKDFEMFRGPVSLNRVVFVFPPLSGWPKHKIAELEAGVTIYKTTKPDLTDNLFKGLIDALSGVVWERDQLICRMGDVSKIYGFRPRTELEIGEA